MRRSIFWTLACSVALGCGGADDPEPSCATDVAAYDAFVAELLTEEATACVTDDDCGLLPSSNDCKSTCQGPAVNKAQSEAIGQRIREYASTHCAECPAEPLVCGAIAYTPQCREGVCD